MGGLVASLGFISPSVIIITLIAGFLKNFSHIVWIQHAFSGIRIAVSALVLYSVINMVKKNANTSMKFLIFILTFLAIGVFDLSPILIVIIVAGLGIGLGRVKNA